LKKYRSGLQCFRAFDGTVASRFYSVGRFEKILLLQIPRPKNFRFILLYVGLVHSCVITCHAFNVNSKSGGASARHFSSVEIIGG
jgi:hypothetical protein